MHVLTKVPEAVLRRDLDLRALAKESAGTVGAGRSQGMTVVEHQLAFRTRVKSEASRGRVCVWFDELTVDLSPAAVSIFVPREYPVDSCEYLAVLEHEREHERVHRERLTAAGSAIADALAAAKWLPARGNPMEASDKTAAEAALTAKIKKVVAPVFDKYKEDLTLAQAELDRPDLYEWFSKRCAGWK